MKVRKRNRVFATNSDFLITISLDPNVADLRYFKLYLCNLQCRKSYLFQTRHSVRSNNLSLNYQRFTTSGCLDKEIGTLEFVAKTQFLC